MHKYGESKTTRIMMATVPHVTAWAGRTKYQADGFLFDWVYREEVWVVTVTLELSSWQDWKCSSLVTLKTITLMFVHSVCSEHVLLR